MDSRSLTSETRTRIAAALGASLIVHLTVLSAFALVGFDLSGPREDVIVETAFQSDPTPWMITTPVAAHANAGGAELAPEESVLDAAGLSVSYSAPRLNSGGSGMSLGPLIPTSSLATKIGPSGGGIGNGEGGGVGDGEGPGQGGGRFFGLNRPGKKIVYVVDCSLSMNHPHPGPAKTRLGRVKLELLNSVRGLHEDQEFFIIFFNDNAYPMPSDRLVEATNSSKKRFLEWMVKARPDGHTDPRMALLLGLRLQPDLLYFLTDGDFGAAVVKEVANVNQGRVAIHTIGFGDNVGEPLLKAIAEQNRGEYQFIPQDEAPKKDKTASAPTISAR